MMAAHEKHIIYSYSSHIQYILSHPLHERPVIPTASSIELQSNMEVKSNILTMSQISNNCKS
jgi:hypothetical protein